MNSTARTFDTFAPQYAPQTLDEVVAWFAFMNDHSATPHPDDSAREIEWSTQDLVELFENDENLDRYERARRAACAIADRHWVDVYALAGGETPARARMAKAHDLGEHDHNESVFADVCPVCEDDADV